MFSLNPKQLDRFHDRHTMTGAKDDRRDALVLADSLRTDPRAFRKLVVDDPLVIRIRELSRMHEDLREMRNVLTNGLREQIFRFAPHVLTLCQSADEAWFLDLLKAFRGPKDIPAFSLDEAAHILKRHRIRKVNANDVVAVLRRPEMTVAPGASEAALCHIAMLIPQIELILSQRAQCEKDIDRALKPLHSEACEGKMAERRDIEIILSIPGVGNLIAATMLAEASDCLRRRDSAALRAHAEIAPVRRRSGKKCVVSMRKACNPRLRNALYHLARVAVQKDEVSRGKHASLRSRGHSHGRALRSVADGLLRVMMGMLQSNTMFSMERRQAGRAAHAA